MKPRLVHNVDDGAQPAHGEEHVTARRVARIAVGRVAAALCRGGLQRVTIRCRVAISWHTLRILWRLSTIFAAELGGAAFGRRSVGYILNAADERSEALAKLAKRFHGDHV